MKNGRPIYGRPLYSMNCFIILLFFIRSQASLIVALNLNRTS